MSAYGYFSHVLAHATHMRTPFVLIFLLRTKIEDIDRPTLPDSVVVEGLVGWTSPHATPCLLPLYKKMLEKHLTATRARGVR